MRCQGAETHDADPCHVNKPHLWTSYRFLPSSMRIPPSLGVGFFSLKPISQKIFSRIFFHESTSMLHIVPSLRGVRHETTTISTQ
jgi:hypothetical protein